ncbi:YveK family protein [Paenibacillus endoradicis]|uniref:YveK family protein n=1 Tax=Paenibacillus endoradicis TaxID=2972487 RepID=UPI00215951E9|nr:Wzz/FepE/Etk N-terminal domain-containing protein [Paenibacillus endoradicis]MCR8660651.1 Wzz/FepE/Etk N-terminal domain-containing protein [Paenibacillus endoradicis]
MELELRDYVEIIKKRLWLIGSIVAILAVATAVVSYFFIKPEYESTTKLIVNNNNEVSSGLDLNSVNLDLRLIDTYKQIIKTTAITDEVALRNPSLQLTGEQIIELITVSSVNNTQVLTISARHHDYATTVKLVNEVAAVFVQQIPTIMTVNNVSILNEAKFNNNPSPVQPNPMLNIAISIVIGLMLGVGISLLLEYLDDTIKDPQDVAQYLDLPVLISIPRLTSDDFKVGAARTASRATRSTRVEANKNVTINE